MGQEVRSVSDVAVHLAARDIVVMSRLRQVLKPYEFIRITGTSSDTKAAVAAVRAESPDVLVVSSTDEQELENLLNSASLAGNQVKVVVLTDAPTAAALGAMCPRRLEGILLQDGNFLEDFGAVLRIVHRGGRVGPGHQARDVSFLGSRTILPELRERLLDLTTRETLILRAVAQGRTNAQIAQPLHVSVATVKADLARIMDIMRASNRVHLAALASQSGLVNLES